MWLLTGDVRNDIYVTLMQGELRRGAGGKVADKNVEVTITVCNQDGEVIPVCIMLHYLQQSELCFQCFDTVGWASERAFGL